MSSVDALVAEMTKPPSILVIDDEYVIRYTFERLAHVYEMNLVCVPTVEEGIQAIMKQQEKFDVVFLDMKFEDATTGSVVLTGMDALRKLNLINYDGHIIVMSGSINLHDIMHEANKLGVLSFMAKPVEFTTKFLTAILKRLGIRLYPKSVDQPPEI